ncbi:cell division protein FtsQ/DivIB [Nakamurella leprariae]|uniref:FtsQ-type POTRA domain-containing protein n=1 Tax=Nakamurella leprariae TaxID=2803911 RepID=A0A939BY66_9ACTN|nr:FtsQ-type POTRA domain-containing protein [Nakamurella leprariae]MBM9469253.1 FtsQ-type POTRA domain-containing protein [Nakamurella leprariae]
MSGPTRTPVRPTGPRPAEVASARPVRARRRRWPLLVGLATVAVLLVAGFVVAWFTPVLGVRSVQVDGITAATGGDAAADPSATTGDPAAAEQVRAEVLAASGVALDTPLARVDPAAVAARVAALPGITAAEVERAWPDTLLITVELPVPVAVTQANDSWWLLDATGEPYRTVAGRESVPTLPVVELATPGPQDPATLAAVRVSGVLPESLRAQLAAVAATSPYDVTLRLTDGRTVRWGTAGPDPGVAATAGDGSDDTTLDVDTARKLQVLPAVLQQPGTVFDISDPTLVSVR